LPVRCRISSVVTSGTNQTGVIVPGIASCFTRISCSAKLWITSLLESCTSTGRPTGRWSWLIVVTSSFAAGSLRSIPSGFACSSTSVTSVLPKTPSGPG
jgi:hypothetical protein